MSPAAVTADEGKCKTPESIQYPFLKVPYNNGMSRALLFISSMCQVKVQDGLHPETLSEAMIYLVTLKGLPALSRTWAFPACNKEARLGNSDNLIQIYKQWISQWKGFTTSCVWGLPQKQFTNESFQRRLLSPFITVLILVIIKASIIFPFQHLFKYRGFSNAWSCLLLLVSFW